MSDTEYFHFPYCRSADRSALENQLKTFSDMGDYGPYCGEDFIDHIKVDSRKDDDFFISCDDSDVSSPRSTVYGDCECETTTESYTTEDVTESSFPRSAYMLDGPLFDKYFASTSDKVAIEDSLNLESSSTNAQDRYFVQPGKTQCSAPLRSSSQPINRRNFACVRRLCHSSNSISTTPPDYASDFAPSHYPSGSPLAQSMTFSQSGLRLATIHQNSIEIVSGLSLAYNSPDALKMDVDVGLDTATTSESPRTGGLTVSTGSLSSISSSDLYERALQTMSLTSTEAIQDVLDSKASWNERFQLIYDAPESEAKYDALHHLSMDFLGVAETYGRVIIAELSLPDHEKSIKPINIGGLAGGTKYAVQGLLFKFAVDGPRHYIYGSDEFAQKAANQELIGLNQWSLNSEGLHFPLMALIRYCGFTLVALSILPIAKGSLVYGSDDAGKTVHFEDDEIYEKMKKTALNLNLKGHFLEANMTKKMYGPGDIEGHRGTDSLHYVLDFARVYPPAALIQGEGKEKSRCLFRMLRPELVSRFKKPLSSDAFMAWGRVNSLEHNSEVREATAFMIENAIPKLADEILTLKDYSTLTRLFHLHGVNMRYMGLVRRVVYTKCENAGTSKAKEAWLLREMVARAVKSLLAQKWRELIRKYQRTTPDRCIREAITILNSLVEPQTTAGSFAMWGKLIREILNAKFPLALIDQEAIINENGVPLINLQEIVFGGKAKYWNFFIDRISALTGLRFISSIKAEGIFPSFGVLSTGDVIEIRSSVKRMSLVDYAYVISKTLSGLRQLSPVLASRILGFAIERLQEAPAISFSVLRRIVELKSHIVLEMERMKWEESVTSAVAQLVRVALEGARVLHPSMPSQLVTEATALLLEIQNSS